MNIDVHVHILSPDFIKDIKKIWIGMHTSNCCMIIPKQNLPSRRCFGEHGKTEIDKSIVFGFSCLDPGMARSANDYIIETVKTPDRFIGFAIFPPQDPGLERN